MSGPELNIKSINAIIKEPELELYNNNESKLRTEFNGNLKTEPNLN